MHAPLMLGLLVAVACAVPHANLVVEGVSPVVVDAGSAPAAAVVAPVVAAEPPAPDAGTPVKKVAAPMNDEVKALVDRVQSFYEKTTDFSADFRQDYTYKSFKRTQTSTGTVIYKKPATMRWEYLKPTARTFVLAGDKVYALDPEALTLTKGSISTNQLSASVTFLWGQGKLAEEFSISKQPCPKCAGTLLILDPLKPDPRFRQVKLEVDPRTAQVLKSTVIDPDGSENAISFSKLTTNVGIDEKAFKISPPAGTQVIDMSNGLPQPQAPKP